MKLLKTDLERLRADIISEQRLVDIGRARLKADDAWYPEDERYPDTFIKIARQTPDDTKDWVTSKRFLDYGAVFHKHIALHHYPEGEDRIGFKYPPRG